MDWPKAPPVKKSITVDAPVNTVSGRLVCVERTRSTMIHLTFALIFLVLSLTGIACTAQALTPTRSLAPTLTPVPTVDIEATVTAAVAAALPTSQRTAIFIDKLELQRRAEAAVVPTCFPPTFNGVISADIDRERYRDRLECERKSRQDHMKRATWSNLAGKSDGWNAVFQPFAGRWRVSVDPIFQLYPQEPADPPYESYVYERTGRVEGPLPPRLNAIR